MPGPILFRGLSLSEFVYTDRGGIHGTGWVPRPAAVEAVLRELRRAGKPATVEEIPQLVGLYGSTDDPVFMWDAEVKQFGRVLPSWDQGQVGTCVSFGYARGVQDLLLNEVHFLGHAERWPDAEIATEPIYALSRVEVGGGGLDGDGSVGAWAAKAVRQWGMLLRKSYAAGGRTYDLSRYSESLSRQWGDAGLPDALEPEAKLHPVTEVALVTTAEGLWAAIGARKAVPVCSMQGFATTRDADGYCARQGQWAHCMLYRGRFVHPTKGKSVVIQNSWGGYLRGPDQVKYKDADGQVKTFTLPEGCFCVPLTVAAEAIREGDTFALAGFTGWVGDGPTPPPPGPGPNPEPSAMALPKNWGISFGTTTPYVKQADGSYVASGTFSIRVTKLASSELPPLEDALANLFIPARNVEAFGLKLPKVIVPAVKVEGTTGGPAPVGDLGDFLVPILRRVAAIMTQMDPPVKQVGEVILYILDRYDPAMLGAAGINLKEVLALLCQYAPYLPQPYGAILSMACRFLPRRDGKPCGGDCGK
jgi:hypothetical protein